MNYTEEHEILRGGRWPPINYVRVRMVLTDADGDPVNWPADTDEWIWRLLLSRYLAKIGPDLVLDADSVTVAANVLTLCFHATVDQTDALPGTGQVTFRVDLMSIVAGSGTTTTVGAGLIPGKRFWPQAAGTALVRNVAGQGS